jgi:hypothetical protein
MVGSHLFVILITACFSYTISAVVDPNSNEHVRVQRRTWDEAITMAKSFVTQLTLEEKCNMTLGVRVHVLVMFYLYRVSVCVVSVSKLLHVVSVMECFIQLFLQLAYKLQQVGIEIYSINVLLQ